MSTLETSALKLGDLQLTGKGAKHIPITRNNEALKWNPGPSQILFHPKAYNDPSASRVSVCFRSTPEIEAYVTKLEEWILNAVSSNPSAYLGQCYSEDKVREMFTSALKTSDKGYTHLRAKMNIAGKGQVKCWDVAKMPRPAPEDWTTCEVQPCLQVKGLWVMSKDFGVIIEMTDALVNESSQLCPF
jgi:hypothetical protein